MQIHDDSEIGEKLLYPGTSGDAGRNDVKLGLLCTCSDGRLRFRGELQKGRSPRNVETRR